MVVLLQAHKVMQGIAKHTPYIMLYEGVCGWCWWVGKVDIPLVDSAKELRGLIRSTTLVAYS